MKHNQCQCGGYVHKSQHEVKTKNGLMNWTQKDYKLPVFILQYRCESCGRYEKKLWDKENSLRLE